MEPIFLSGILAFGGLACAGRLPKDKNEDKDRPQRRNTTPNLLFHRSAEVHVVTEFSPESRSPVQLNTGENPTAQPTPTSSVSRTSEPRRHSAPPRLRKSPRSINIDQIRRRLFAERKDQQLDEQALKFVGATFGCWRDYSDEVSLARRADPHIENRQGLSGLWLAAQDLHVDSFKIMLEQGKPKCVVPVDLEWAKKGSKTLLYHLAEMNQPLCMEALLDSIVILMSEKVIPRGALSEYINRRQGSNCGGFSALHITYVRNHEKCKKILLESGADENVKDDQGRTPKWFALNYVL